MSVNVTELRKNLPMYLKRVSRGERVIVTSRGKPIAELSPPRSTKQAAAIARGRLRGSVLSYDRPLEPGLTPDEWDVNA